MQIDATDRRLTRSVYRLMTAKLRRLGRSFFVFSTISASELVSETEAGNAEAYYCNKVHHRHSQALSFIGFPFPDLYVFGGSQSLRRGPTAYRFMAAPSFILTHTCLSRYRMFHTSSSFTFVCSIHSLNKIPASSSSCRARS